MIIPFWLSYCESIPKSFPFPFSDPLLSLRLKYNGLEELMRAFVLNGFASASDLAPYWGQGGSFGEDKGLAGKGLTGERLVIQGADHGQLGVRGRGKGGLTWPPGRAASVKQITFYISVYCSITPWKIWVNLAKYLKINNKHRKGTTNCKSHEQTKDKYQKT